MFNLFKKTTIERKNSVLGINSKNDISGVPSVFHGKKNKLRSRFLYPGLNENGKLITIFKVLQTNYCIHNCSYCSNRRDRDCERVSFQPEELASLFMQYCIREWTEGIFISSAIYPTANKAQERILATIQILRNQCKFRGFIHAVVLPGADLSYVEEMGKYADRLSLNIEVPKGKYLKKLSPDKNYQNHLLKGLATLAQYDDNNELSGGITTQLIVGASGETDKEILALAGKLYDTHKLRRVYYSGFEPINDTPMAELPACSKIREFRLYQADLLIRRYGFRVNELTFDKSGNLGIDKDPKLKWAEANSDSFPVDVNKAGFDELIRVPGIGVFSANKILDARKGSSINTLINLHELGTDINKAKVFITINGKGFNKKNDGKSKTSKNLFLWEEL